MEKRLIVALLLLGLAPLRAVGGEMLLTFEGGRASLDGSVVLSNGYGGLQWSGLNVGSASPQGPGEQYRRGTVSGTNVVIGYGDSFVISSGRPFDLRSAWFTAMSSNAPQLRVVGLMGTNKVVTNIFRPALMPTRVDLNFTNVTAVQFGPFANGMMMDDVAVSLRDVAALENPWLRLNEVVFADGPAQAVAAGDFNGDGWGDFAHVGTNSTVMELSNRDGTRRRVSMGLFNMRQDAAYMTTADVNRDGRADVLIPAYTALALVATNTNAVSIVARMNTYNGKVLLVGDFVPGQVGANPGPAYAGVTGDFNQDGRLDYAYVYQTTANLTVFSNTGGAGVFTKYLEKTPEKHYGVAAADFDRDGDLDLAVANYIGGTVGVWKNDGTGNFAEPLRFSSGAAPVNLIAQDVTGDGLIDVVVRSAFGGLTVMAGAGDGSFAAPVTVVAAASPFAVTSYGLSSSDFNNDGRPDIAFVSGSEIVILHNVAPPALRIEAVGEVMRIRWAKDFAREAILESAPTLDGEWTEHPFPPLGLDEEAMIFDSGAASTRFFRVRRR